MSSTSQLRPRLPASLLSTIAPARELARREGMRLFLVCGAVRDALLGRPIEDVDLAVEGDAIAFGRRLARSMGGRVTAHERFGTAKLELPGGGRLDLAGTRRETYDAPAALPRVHPAPIEEDLSRRDFTINALALELAPRGRARLLDPFEGKRDLERGIVRMLHPRSPMDDPTRAFRAVRFANRFGFRIEPATASWIRDAVAAGAFERLSGERLRRELQRIFSEADPASAVRRMSSLGIVSTISPALSADRSSLSRLRRTERIAGAHPGLTGWLAFLLAWSAELDDSAAERLSRRLALDARGRRMLTSWPATLAALAGGAMPQESSADELAAAAGAQADLRARRRIEALLDAPHVALSIRGRDLLRAGVPAGPAVGRALTRTLQARRSGQISTEAELAYALAVARKEEA